MYAYFIEYKEKEKKDKIKAFNEQVLSINKNEINKISINTNDDEIAFDKINGIWKIIKPITWKADTSKINAIIDEILKPSKLVLNNPSDEDLNKFGINNKLILKLTNSKTYKIVFGDKSPVSDERYVQSIGNTNKIVLAKKELFSNFTSELQSFRDKSVFDNLNVKKLRFGKYTFLKNDNTWHQENKLFSLDEESLSSTLNEILSMQVKNFLINKNLDDENLKKIWNQYNLKKSKYDFTTNDENQYVLYFSKLNDKNYFAYKSISKNNSTKLSQVFEIDSIDVFDKTIFDFRKKDIFNFDNSKVSSVELIDDKKFIVLNKNNDSWTSIENKNIDNVKVNSFLSKINSIQVLEFLNNNKFKNSKFNKSLILKNDKNIILQIDFGKVNDDKVLIKYNNECYYINNDILDNFNIKEFLLE